jgi:FixJ family two-component response regulator
MAASTRVYVVDGDDVVRRALSHLLAGAGHDVTTFETAEAFIELSPFVASGCVLATVRPPQADGFPPPTVLNAQRPDLPVIIRSPVHADVVLAVQTIKAGAADFLDPSSSDEQVLAAVQAAQRQLRAASVDEEDASSTAARVAKLPDEERDVLRGLLAGGTNVSIAKRQGLTPRTVAIHRARLMERLGAHSLSEAVRMAVAAGLQASA